MFEGIALINVWRFGGALFGSIILVWGVLKRHAIVALGGCWSIEIHKNIYVAPSTLGQLAAKLLNTEPQFSVVTIFLAD